MPASPRYPSLFQINTRVWLRRLSRERGRPVTLADIDAATIDGFARQGFDWIWLLSVWQTGPAGRAVSRGNPAWRAEFKAALPDLTEDDICGSGFAITGYAASEEVGGDQALAAFREKLAQHGIRLMLDFVPNHTAIDHPWVAAHPEYYVQGSEALLAGAPQNYLRVETAQGPRILAHGRDPNFPGWPDTLQLDYANPDLQRAKRDELLAVAGKCDGVRCDMAMLLLPDVFQRTWGTRPGRSGRRRRRPCGGRIPASPSWPRSIGISNGRCSSRASTIATTSDCMTACRPATPSTMRDHLNAGLDYQDRLARFLENHDEPRAASAFPWPQHRAAAAITFLSPGLRFFQQGERRGRTRARADAPLPRTCRTRRRGDFRFLRPTAACAAGDRRVSRRRLDATPSHPRLARQRKLEWLRGLLPGRARRASLTSSS